MPKTRRKKRTPKRVFALPDLEQSKAAVVNGLTSKSGWRTYDRAITDFVDWYCSEPRLPFNRTVVLRYRISLVYCDLVSIPLLTLCEATYSPRSRNVFDVARLKLMKGR